MAITIKLKHGLNAREEQWLAKNIGPRLHYIHNSIGGQGWIAKHTWNPGVVNKNWTQNSKSKHWTLTFENESYASFFLIKFPQ
jgi:hypothetical protein